MQLDSTTAAALVRRLQARDPQALAELYDQCGTYVYRVAWSLVRDVTTAEHLTQETFLYVWNRIQTFDGTRGSLVTWTGMIVRSRTIDYLRSVDGRMARSTAPLEDAGRCADPFQDRGFQQVERIRMLEGPWKRLRACDRRVLRLAYYSGLSQSEIAEHLNQPLGTVKTWIRRGLQALRADLEGADAV